ncbi:hypothetical protein, partial [uncultured Legionella sp.]|uniref:hypothetical protein n=1 Tax=uncultured Legionella sp. TaxID=210934 RepID=UPI002634B2EA
LTDTSEKPDTVRSSLSYYTLRNQKQPGCSPSAIRAHEQHGTFLIGTLPKSKFRLNYSDILL